MGMLDDLVLKVAQLHYSKKTARSYRRWCKKFIEHFKTVSFGPNGFRVVHWRHPREMGRAEVEQFLSYLAAERHVSASTQNQALAAILFLFKHVLGIKLENVNALRAKRSARLPVVLSVPEVAALLNQLARGLRVHWLAAALLYGCGLRIGECCALRIQNIDPARRQLIVRGGKGNKDRALPLPEYVVDPLRRQIQSVDLIRRDDIRRRLSGVSLPDAYARKSPGARLALPWYYVFPADKLSRDPDEPDGPLLRHHMHASGLAKAVKLAGREAGILKPVKCHGLRHAFATHLQDAGVGIRTIQELLGHSSIKTTQIYLHVELGGHTSTTSPLDRLGHRLAAPAPRLGPQIRRA